MTTGRRFIFMEQISDQQLISDYLKGNENSFRILVSRYLNPIFGFSYRLIGSKNDSEDITQEVFVKVWKNLKKYDSKQNFKTWLFAIARNTIFDHLRKRKEFVFSDFENNDGENEFTESIVDENENIEDKIFKTENAGVLKTAINKLSKSEQEILSLRYEEDFTFDEMSKILKKPLNTVKSQHRRIVLKLKDWIATG